MNARGFASPLTYNLLFDLIETSNCHVCVVQKTLVSAESTIKSLSRRWLGCSFWSPASGRQGGVVTLILSKCSDEIVSWKKDSHGLHEFLFLPLRSSSQGILTAMIMLLINLVETFLFTKNTSH